ncbi:MAG: hypothetical protein ACP5JG_11220 [Anaerolineae bacterium]
MTSDQAPQVQDPNAADAAMAPPGPRIATGDRAYLVDMTVGAGRLIVCTLRLLDDPAGRYLLSRLLRQARRASS